MKWKENEIMSNKVKVMRILIYEGDYEWVKIALESTEVPIEGIKKFGNNRIKSALIDKLPEIMNESNVDINNSMIMMLIVIMVMLIVGTIQNALG
jgi:hypothetical protein